MIAIVFQVGRRLCFYQVLYLRIKTCITETQTIDQEAIHLGWEQQVL